MLDPDVHFGSRTLNLLRVIGSNCIYSLLSVTNTKVVEILFLGIFIRSTIYFYNIKKGQDTVVLGVSSFLLTRRAQDRIPSPTLKREKNSERKLNLETKGTPAKFIDLKSYLPYRPSYLVTLLTA